ncbi:MAG: universal stress protein [Methyloligellaceae bacterium]
MAARGKSESGRTGDARQSANPSRRRKLAGTGEADTSATPERFSILVCIDGTEDANRAVKYATRIGSGTDADMTMLYVRPIDQGLRTGGLQISVARENMLSWGLELPGMKTLKKARDMLVDLGFMSESWEEESQHTDVQGDPLGDNLVVYTSDQGQHLTLKLMVSPSVARGILDECEMSQYDLVIVPHPEDPSEGGGPGYIDVTVGETVAVEHHGTVLVTRALEESHGHLVCVWNNEQSIAAARRDAQIASRCACPVFLYAVAPDESALPEAETAVANAKAAIEEVGVNISGAKVDIGDPVDKIVEEGRDYSVIVMSSSARTGLRRFFTTGVSFEVLQRAHNSVMIAR